MPVGGGGPELITTELVARVHLQIETLKRILVNHRSGVDSGGAVGGGGQVGLDVVLRDRLVLVLHCYGAGRSRRRRRHRHRLGIAMHRCGAGVVGGGRMRLLGRVVRRCRRMSGGGGHSGRHILLDWRADEGRTGRRGGSAQASSASRPEIFLKPASSSSCHSSFTSGSGAIRNRRLISRGRAEDGVRRGSGARARTLDEDVWRRLVVGVALRKLGQERCAGRVSADLAARGERERTVELGGRRARGRGGRQRRRLGLEHLRGAVQAARRQPLADQCRKPLIIHVVRRGRPGLAWLRLETTVATGLMAPVRARHQVFVSSASRPCRRPRRPRRRRRRRRRACARSPPWAAAPWTSLSASM